MKGVIKTKELIYACLISCAISFMLFLYEPITLYANNMNDFWFDFYTLISPSLLFFTSATILIFIIFVIVFFLSKKTAFKNLYYLVIIFAIICFLCAYIHSNFLAGFLPPLDGTKPDWSSKTANIISIGICIIVTITFIVLVKKTDYRKVIKYSSTLVMAIVFILFLSLTSTAITTDVFKQKEFIADSTTKNINLISNEKNFIILLLDAVDSVQFNKIVSSDNSYQQTFKDFSYYPDTVSAYSFTRDSIPFIFSGVWNENQTPFDEYSTSAYNNSDFFKKLSEKEYNKNLYESELVWNDQRATEFNNIENSSIRDIKKKALLKQEIKYILYKSLPFPLKHLSKIETLDFSETKPVNDIYKWDNWIFYNDYLKRPLEKTNQNYFSFTHIEGGHVPFNITENLEPIPGNDGTYEQKLEADMKIIKEYLNKLKNNSAYDNSVIVIMADHGFWHKTTSRANAILYIKGINEKHNKMIISKKQIAFEDLSPAFIELLNDKKSDELFGDIPTSGRIRRHIYNGYGAEERLIEYNQTGNAWEDDKLQLTGKEYNL